jgi:DNA invertase Pin-like site-specific DNA recombinase
MNVALYARVSKLHSHQDPEVQLRDLRAWCAGQKHIIVAEYVDRGVSGAKEKRPKLDEMMRHAEQGRFEAVGVWKLDRFARSVRHLHNAVHQLQGWDVALISFKDNFDLSTAMGKAMFTVIAMVAELERDIIAERIKAGLRHARAKGHIPGRKIDPKKGPSRTTLWRRRSKST